MSPFLIWSKPLPISKKAKISPSSRPARSNEPTFDIITSVHVDVCHIHVKDFLVLGPLLVQVSPTLFSTD